MWLHTYCMHHLFLTGHERSVFTVTQGAEHVLHDLPLCLTGHERSLFTVTQGAEHVLHDPPLCLTGHERSMFTVTQGAEHVLHDPPLFLTGHERSVFTVTQGTRSNVAAQSCYSVRPAVQVQCCFKPTETIRTIRDREPSMPWPLHLSHSS